MSWGKKIVKGVVVLLAVTVVALIVWFAVTQISGYVQKQNEGQDLKIGTLEKEQEQQKKEQVKQGERLEKLALDVQAVSEEVAAVSGVVSKCMCRPHPHPHSHTRVPEKKVDPLLRGVVPMTDLLVGVEEVVEENTPPPVVVNMFTVPRLGQYNPLRDTGDCWDCRHHEHEHWGNYYSPPTYYSPPPVYNPPAPIIGHTPVGNGVGTSPRGISLRIEQ